MAKELTKPLHAFFNLFGVDIIRTRRADGTGVEPGIIGSFPRYAELNDIGAREDYFIHGGYIARAEPTQFDDTSFADEWQREVYKYAREVFDAEKLGAVCDVGCGSAYKLVKYFRDAKTVGLDIPATCEWLRRKYPDRTWLESDFKTPPKVRIDLVIASDVIEHLLYPNDLLSFMEALAPSYAIISTPDRNLLRSGTHNGPPRNPAHVREWSMKEFHAYIESRFEVLEHFISNAAQGTQCVLAAPK